MIQRHNSCPICADTNLVETENRLRDSKDLKVLKCQNCEHVFLESFEHIDTDYFVSSDFLLSKPVAQGVESRRRHYDQENNERAERMRPLVVNKRVLDFGCGAGTLMTRLAPLCEVIHGVEPTASFNEALRGEGYTIFENTDDVSESYDVILMFHVLEHLSEGVEIMAKLRERLNPGGLIYIEVPNINDALLSLYDSREYRKFHFFRDHLHYFSRGSLSKALQMAGFETFYVHGHSRFGPANHLHWLSKGKGGGHLKWSFLERGSVFREYAATLASADMSDSLVAQASV